MTRRFRAPEIPLGHGRALILHPRFKPPYLFKRTFIARALTRVPGTGGIRATVIPRVVLCEKLVSVEIPSKFDPDLPDSIFRARR